MDKVALLIGVSECQPGWPPLPGAVKDVEAMQRILANPEMGDFAEADVTVLKNPQRQEMEAAIEQLFNNRQKEDLVLLYFSGHGIKDEKVNLDLDGDLSRFKGANRPVEKVSWYEATEFCARLSHKTGKRYRLPSEAEWEYACRARTTTPFHFGETITTDLANYQGKQTTDVGSFGVANAFGLYDMHGNVWEWCQDTWHENYEQAPIDGSAWLSENDNQYRLLRGGSWYNVPRSCRSADRNYYDAGDGDYDVGVRVVCSAEWTS